VLRYPLYIISKGRADGCLTARWLSREKIQFKLVVEPQEKDAYSSRYGEERLLVLPFSNLGQGSIPARNWVWEHAKALGAEKHWILDDNIRGMIRCWKAKRIGVSGDSGFRCVEDFSDRYENIAIAGINYYFFVGSNMGARKVGRPPFYLNTHVYSCLLIKNDLPYRWRGRYNEDTDLCLQVLSGGWCTILVNAFSIKKSATMSMRGGNTDELYEGDGRLEMSRSLERRWGPYVVSTKRMFKRPQHYVRSSWRRFDTPLKLKPGLVVKDGPNEYGLKLVQVAPIKSERVRKILERSKAKP